MYTIDLEFIKEDSSKKEKENIEFRVHLKNMESKKVDRIVHKIYKKVAPKINCKKCANCCKKLKIEVTEEDIIKISNFLEMNRNEFKENFLEKDNIIKIKENGECVFLKFNICTIYSTAPLECKSFPHIHKKDFASRTWEMIDYYELCPIVYNVIEETKKEMNFPKESNVPREFLESFEND